MVNIGKSKQKITLKIFAENKVSVLFLFRSLHILCFSDGYLKDRFDAPSVAGGEPFARGFRLIDAGLEEDPYLATLLEGELAGSVPLQRRTDTLRKLLLRLHNYIAVALNGCLIVGLRRALLLF